MKKKYLIILSGISLSAVAFSACASNLTNHKVITAKSGSLTPTYGKFILTYPTDESGNIDGQYCTNDAGSNATLKITRFDQFENVPYLPCSKLAHGICRCTFTIRKFKPDNFNDANLVYTIGQGNNPVYKSYNIAFHNNSHTFSANINNADNLLTAGAGVTVTPTTSHTS